MSEPVISGLDIEEDTAESTTPSLLRLESSDHICTTVDALTCQPSLVLSTASTLHQPPEACLDIHVDMTHSTLSVVLAYLAQLRQGQVPTVLPKPLPIGTHFENLLAPWEYRLMEPLTSDVLVLVANAANLLDIPPLLGVCLARLAWHIRGQSSTALRTLFGIRDDFTRAERKLLTHVHTR